MLRGVFNHTLYLNKRPKIIQPQT
uniref:Uncharacterized protein n=1 Tax=Rhizophora mucronata TaxID=61149 RepID=A0A2P2PHM0_RHIMU